MCGIIAAIINPKAENKIDANEFVINQFEDQNSRGKEGFGIMRFTNKKLEGIDRACTPMKFLIDLYKHKSESIIAHHRTPTSTDNKLAQTHPIFVSNKELTNDYYIIHNGVIRNDQILKKIHEELGYKYTTEYFQNRYYQYNQTFEKICKYNDSEAMAIDLARYIEKKQPEMKIQGSAAFMAIQLKKNSNTIINIFFGRRINPLNIKIEKDYLLLSSEGEGEEIESNQLFSIGISKNRIDKEDKFILHKREIKFEDERLKKEEEEKQQKAISFLPAPQKSPIGFNKEQNTKIIENTEQKTNIRETIGQERAIYESQLQAMETIYWDEAKTKGIERGKFEISKNMEEGIDARKDLIDEILIEFIDKTMQPEFDQTTEKPRKTMTLMMISKILSSIETIAAYEGYNLEQIAREEELLDAEDSPICSKMFPREDMDYTPEGIITHPYGRSLYGHEE